MNIVSRIAAITAQRARDDSGEGPALGMEVSCSRVVVDMAA
jgi:hypothetical protein